MSEEYYVIVNLHSLEYQKDGEGVRLKEADKFETLQEAKEELTRYDEGYNLAIYKVKEFTTIQTELQQYQK